MPELNEKQKRFVTEYLVDLNAAKAAARAGYSANYGRELLAISYVSEAVAQARAKVQKKTEITLEKVIKRLWRESNRTGKDASHSARVKALEVLGKHLGMYTDPLPLEQLLNGLDPVIREIVKEALRQALQHQRD